MMFNIPGHNNAAMRHKGTDTETPQFFGGSKGYSRIQTRYLEDNYKNRHIRPIGNERLKIDAAIIGKNKIKYPDPEETQSNGKHDPKHIRENKGSGCKGGTGTAKPHSVPYVKFGKCHTCGLLY